MPRPLILIVGVQKSGTTLLSRLLQQTGVCGNPFTGEGDDFWGNVPAFSPRVSPAGTIYQRSGGEDGHVIGAADATNEVRGILYTRLNELPATAPIIVNKNPYNTVRLPWLRAMFPEARIVAMVRDPVANVFSLTKKYVPHEGRGQPPEEGWWGVKPRGWRSMIADDKVRQCAAQWEAVNRQLLGDAEFVDVLVHYRELCESPEEQVRRILERVEIGHLEQARLDVAPIRCLDDEFTVGSRLQSKNRYFRSSGTFDVPDDEPKEIEPLRSEDIEAIQSICRDTAVELARWR